MSSFSCFFTIFGKLYCLRLQMISNQVEDAERRQANVNVSDRPMASITDEMRAIRTPTHLQLQGSKIYSNRFDTIQHLDSVVLNNSHQYFLLID